MLQLILDGIILGCIIALGAVGLSLTYKILNFANFAHGDIMALGAYLAFLFHVTAGLPLGAAFLLAVVFTTGVGLALDRILYRPLRRYQNPTILLIASVGVALILRNVIVIIWGPQIQYYSQEIQPAWQLPLGLRIKPTQVLIMVLSAALVAATHLFLHRTKMGKAMRASADNLDLAWVTGININRVILSTWVVGLALAAAGGILLGMDVQLRPMMGWNLLLPIFAATILGGIGSFQGALVGALVVGVAQEVSTHFDILLGYKHAVAFVIMVAMLLVRPTGLFGRSVRWN